MGSREISRLHHDRERHTFASTLLSDACCELSGSGSGPSSTAAAAAQVALRLDSNTAMCYSTCMIMKSTILYVLRAVHASGIVSRME